MGSSKNLSMLAMLVGIILVVVFLLADPIGIGGDSSFKLSNIGTRQIIGIVVGIVVLAGGAVMYRRPS